MDYIIKYSAYIFGFLGAIAATLRIFRHFKKPKKYDGKLSEELIHFIEKNHEKIFHLSLQLNEDESQVIFQSSQNPELNNEISFPIPHDEYGTELSFYPKDPELVWNMRFLNSIHTSGYFKVHSSQGPYQGWMSLQLKAVAKESVEK